MRHNNARNVADGGYTKRFVARNVAEVGRNSTAAILHAILRATILGVDTRYNLAIARNIAPCIRTLRCVKHASARALIQRQARKTKRSSIYGYKPIVTY